MARVKVIQKAVKVKLTAGRIADFQCTDGKTQTFLWCSDPAGLAIRATINKAKSYIFQAKVKGKSMRFTIGDVKAWSIEGAKTEARRLQVLIDQGCDPREVKADKEAAREAHTTSLKSQQARESITLGMAWAEYIEIRKPQWSERHYRDHVTSMHPGGVARQRSDKKTIAGVLASLTNIRLVDLTPERVEEWARVEVMQRPTRARLALGLLKAFLFWCSRHHSYKAIVTSNAAQSKEAREILGKPKVKNDTLQKEQLPAWFDAVKQIPNPVIGAYLQTLLLTGARREELATLLWADVDFQWNSLTIKDKVEGQRVVPLTPFVAHILSSLPRRSKWVFSSPTSATGYLAEPSIAHRKACSIAGLDMTLHGLRRSFASLCEWVEMPGGISAQVMGHKPQGVREQNYIRRPLDLLRKWHIKIEEWILNEAGIKFVPTKDSIRLVK
jgi:integrase